MLDRAEPTLLLGRRFMSKLGPVTFDWENSRVKISHSWITAQSLLRGATRLARAMVAKMPRGCNCAGRSVELVTVLWNFSGTGSPSKGGHQLVSTFEDYKLFLNRATSRNYSGSWEWLTTTDATWKTSLV